jgi:glycine oxidase
MPASVAGGDTAPVLIVGQGLAGSCLGWACERAGVPFRVADAGHGPAASRVGAGIMNPLTGRRLVPTWQVAEWREEAIGFYRTLESELGLPLMRTLRIRRVYRDAAERARFERRLVDAAVAPWIEASDDRGFWIRGGMQVETSALIQALRRRWLDRGWMIEQSVSGETEIIVPGRPKPRAVIWCVGAGVAPGFGFVPAERAKGEILQGRLPGLAPDVLLNDGRWVLPGADGRVRVGATYERVSLDLDPTPEGRAELMAAARRLTGGDLVMEQSEAAVRMTTPDRRPIIGWHPRNPSQGIFGGLGSKGGLWAPVLARQWLELLTAGRPVAPVVDVARFFDASTPVGSAIKAARP